MDIEAENDSPDISQKMKNFQAHNNQLHSSFSSFWNDTKEIKKC